MEDLWRKESDNGTSPYVNLFESLPKSPVNNIPSNQYRKNNERSTALRMVGNEEFSMEKWEEAMNYYNRSLCFAESESENVGLALANRSACFFQMKMYGKVLIDIELAKKSRIPDRLLPKLEQRKLDSEKLYKMQSRPCERKTKLSYPANSNYSCLADVVEIRTTNEFGRHMVAKCDIPAGKVILIEENFMMVKDDNEPLCYTCFRNKANFVACEQCSAVVFCSAECMEQNSTHKFECGTPFHSMHIEDKLQIKVVLLAIKLFDRNVEDLIKFIEAILVEDPMKVPASLHDEKSKYYFFLKLGKIPPTTFEILPATWDIYRSAMAIPTIADLFDTMERQHFLMHLIGHHFLVTNNNSYGNDTSTTVGLVLSLMNHSCAPNVHSCAVRNQRHNVTIRPVKKGQQLFTTYLSGDEKPFEQRQKEIRQWWGFDCRCEFCRSPGNQSIDVKMALSNPTFRYVCQNYMYKEHHSAVMDKCLKLLNKRVNAPWSMEIQMMAAALGHTYQSTQS